jgi:hypothetical protein
MIDLKRSLRVRRLAALAFVAAAAPACHGSSHLMAELASPVAPITPAASTAKIVFVRASGFAFGVNFMIFDQHRRFLGESVAQSHFAAELAPGEYLLVAKGENTALLRARLDGNKIYYVRVEAHMGVWRARVSMGALHKQSPELAKAKGEELAQTRRLVPLQTEGQAELDGQRGDVEETIANAQKDWASLSPEERAERTLNPEDGEGPDVPAAPAEPVAAPAVAPVVSQPEAPAVAAAPASPERGGGEGRDLVILKNGSRFRGAVTVGATDDTLTIRLPDGNVRSIKAADVRDVQYSEPVRTASVQPRTTPRRASADSPPPPTPAVQPAKSDAAPPTAAHGKTNCNPPYDVDDQNRKVFKPECYLRSGQ